MNKWLDSRAKQWAGCVPTLVRLLPGSMQFKWPWEQPQGEEQWQEACQARAVTRRHSNLHSRGEGRMSCSLRTSFHGMRQILELKVGKPLPTPTPTTMTKSIRTEHKPWDYKRLCKVCRTFTLLKLRSLHPWREAIFYEISIAIKMIVWVRKEGPRDMNPGLLHRPTATTPQTSTKATRTLPCFRFSDPQKHLHYDSVNGREQPGCGVELKKLP